MTVQPVQSSKSEPLVPVVLPAPDENATVEVEMVTLFSIGDDEYQIPKTPSAMVGMRYLRNVREKGDDYAAAELMTELLGEDGFNALCDYPNLPDEQLEAIMKAAQKHVMGSLEKIRGNSGRGPRR